MDGIQGIYNRSGLGCYTRGYGDCNYVVADKVMPFWPNSAVQDLAEDFQNSQPPRQHKIARRPRAF